MAWCEELRIWLLACNSSLTPGHRVPLGRAALGTLESGGGHLRSRRRPRLRPLLRFLSSPDPTLAGPVINAQPPAVEQYGGEYAPYLVERFLRYRDNTLTIYYLMSTWNPYVVVLMRTDLNVVLVDDVR